jgi:hypothetical protein
LLGVQCSTTQLYCPGNIVRNEPIGVKLTYIIDGDVDGSIEEFLRRWIAPVVELWPKIQLGQMPAHASHDCITISPWWTKVEVKRVVFDISAACIGLRRMFQLNAKIVNI